MAVARGVSVFVEKWLMTKLPNAEHEKYKNKEAEEAMLMEF